ncbi:MAG: DUF4157 domain-containing protein [Cyanobacteria bacterium P01_F01_bin.150]
MSKPSTTRAKTQVSATPTPTATASVDGGQALFDSQESQLDSDDALEYDGVQRFAASADPPDDGLMRSPLHQLQRAIAQGHQFDGVAIATHIPATVHSPKSHQSQAHQSSNAGAPIQRMPYPFTYGRSSASNVTVTGEKWEEGMVTLKPQPGAEPQIAQEQITQTGERWKDGAVTLKPESTPAKSSPKSSRKSSPKQTPHIQRQALSLVKERWEGGAVSLKTDPLAAKVSPTGERWKNGMVTLKADSTHPSRKSRGNPTPALPLLRGGSLKAGPTPALPLSRGGGNVPVQTKGGDGSFDAGRKIEGQLKNSRGGGQPLQDGTRNFMESRFGNDFSKVRVHTNAESVQMNRDLSAQAFTHGNDIYFNSGKYSPESTSGKRLLAHELTHTIQQTGPSAVSPKRLDKKASKGNKHTVSRKPQAIAAKVAPKIQTQLIVGAVGDRYEQEADRMADQVMQLQDPPPISRRMGKTNVCPSADSFENQSVVELGDSFDGHVLTSFAHPTQGAVQRSISPVKDLRVQRGEKADIKKDVQKGLKGINDEIESKSTPESEDKEADKGADAGRDLAKDAENELGNAKSKNKAKKAAKKLKKKSEDKSKQVREEADKAKEAEATKEETDKKKAKEQELVETEKQAQETVDALTKQGEGEGEANPDGEGTAEGAAETPQPSDEAAVGIDKLIAPEKLPDPGLIVAPEVRQDKAPVSADEDPAFAAVVSQTEHVAAEQSAHKPAETKAQEAQDSAEDPSQQLRSSQSTQSEEAGEKEPQLFDREAFVSGLLAVLESNKPSSQKDVEEGKGMDGASEGMQAEIDKAKEGAGGDLSNSATRAPDPEVEEPKVVVPAPDAITETGEMLPDGLVDAAAAIPKPKTESEIEAPLAKTAEAIENLIPKNSSKLPPIQTQLMVGAPGDKYEVEADHMADTVMSMAEPAVQPEAATEPPATVQASPEQDVSLELQTPPQPSPCQGEGADPVSPYVLQTGFAKTKGGLRGVKQTPDEPQSQSLQRQSELSQLPDIQLMPGLFLQRKVALDGDAPSQEGNAVPLDQHRMEQYEKEAGVNATGAIKEGKEHFGGAAQAQFRQAEASQHAEAHSAQTDTIASTNQDMFSARMTEFTNVQTSQETAKTEDEASRDRVTQEVQAIYDTTKLNVNTTLARMDSRVNAEFAATDKRAKAVFERRQKQLFKAWKEDYYGKRHPLYIPWMEVKTGWAYVKIRFYLKPFFNTPLWLVNKIFTGLPDEVNQIYEIAREDYLAVQREGVHRIADIVEEEMAIAKQQVDEGRQQVQDYVATLPQELQSVGAEAAASVQAQFDSLEQSIKDKQGSLVEDLKAKYEESLSEIDERIEELKAANASLVSKIASAIADIAKWILRQVIRVLEPPLSLIPGIGSKIGKFLDAFVDDPGGIMSTFFKGLGKGFENFGKNIMKHVVNGLFEWLLGTDIPITFPKKFDLQGVIDIVLQILGMSKDAIFYLASSFLPSWAVELLQMLMEKGMGALSNLRETLEELGVPDYVMAFFEAISDFPKKGIMALWDFIKTIFSSLKGQFITTIITTLIIPEIVIAGIQWLVGLLNPAAGIVKIVKAIVDVIIFLIDNRAMIFQVLQAVADTFSALIDKSWSPVAVAVEYALAKMIPLALGLFVSLLGLGGISKKVSKATDKLRAPVDKGFEKVFKKMGFLLDPVGTIQGGVSGLRDRAKSKKKGKDDDAPSSKNTKKDKDKDGKDKDKNKNAKTEQDDSVKRLKSAMNAVDNTTEKKRDPSSVDKELGGIKKKYDLDTLTLKKKGKEKYVVTGKAKAKTSSSKSKKVQRKSSKSKGVDWNDKANDIKVKTKLKAKKKKGGQFTVDAQLVEEDKIMDEVERKLKFRMKINGSLTSIRAYAARLKTQYKLKKLEVKGNRKLYSIRGEMSKRSAQRQATTGASSAPAISSRVETDIQRAEGRGEAIAPTVRTPMENAFGMDFSPVRIHADSEGDRLSRSLEAKAFTTGQDIFFRQGAYAPDSLQGKHLLAHELTHVVQQSGERPSIIPQKVQRQGAEPPTIQRVAESASSASGLDLWVQREAEDGGGDAIAPSESVADTGDTASASDAAAGMGSMGAGMAGAAVGGMVKQAGVAAVKKGIESFIPTGKVLFSRVSNNNTQLSMKVLVQDRDLDGKDSTVAKEDAQPEEGLPNSLLGDIVDVIMDIVRQDPDPDVVARKLNKVRVMFEMNLIKLITYGEIGDSFEYIVKINGRAKFLRASKIASFLKRLGTGGKKKTGAAISNSPSKVSDDPSAQDPSQDTSKNTATGKSASFGDDKPRAKAPAMTEPQKDIGASETPSSTGKKSSVLPQSPTKDKEADSGADTAPDKASQNSPSSTKAEQSDKETTPSSTGNQKESAPQSKAVSDRTMKITSKFRRIDAETVDVIIRATPQSTTH